MNTSVFKRELAFREILRHTWFLLKKCWRELLVVSIIVYLPLNILLELLTAPLFNDETLRSFIRSTRAAMRVSQVLELLIGSVALMAIALIINARAQNKTISVKSALMGALRRWPAFVGTSLLAGIFFVGLLLLLIIPGVIYIYYWMFVPLVVILSHQSGIKALSYSKQLVQGRFWKYVCYSTLIYTIAIIPIAVLLVLVALVPDQFIFNVFSDLLADILITPIFVVWIVLFLNARATVVSKEKWGTYRRTSAPAAVVATLMPLFFFVVSVIIGFLIYLSFQPDEYFEEAPNDERLYDESYDSDYLEDSTQKENSR